jgi:hypothetical protein
MEEEIRLGYEGLKFLILMYRETLRVSLPYAQDYEASELIGTLINRCARALNAIDRRMAAEGDVMDVKQEVIDIVSQTNQLLSRFEEFKEDLESLERNNMERDEN